MPKPYKKPSSSSIRVVNLCKYLLDFTSLNSFKRFIEYILFHLHKIDIHILSKPINSFCLLPLFRQLHNVWLNDTLLLYSECLFMARCWHVNVFVSFLDMWRWNERWNCLPADGLLYFLMQLRVQSYSFWCKALCGKMGPLRVLAQLCRKWTCDAPYYLKICQVNAV